MILIYGERERGRETGDGNREGEREKQGMERNIGEEKRDGR